MDEKQNSHRNGIRMDIYEDESFIKNPHDAVFKTAFRKKELAADFSGCIIFWNIRMKCFCWGTAWNWEPCCIFSDTSLTWISGNIWSG
jgi:hypothetical protein